MAIGLTDRDPIVRFDQDISPVCHAVSGRGLGRPLLFSSPAAFDPPPVAQRVFATSQQLLVLGHFAQQIMVPSAGFGGFWTNFHLI
jgi:hypothetical protein